MVPVEMRNAPISAYQKAGALLSGCQWSWDTNLVLLCPWLQPIRSCLLTSPRTIVEWAPAHHHLQFCGSLEQHEFCSAPGIHKTYAAGCEECTVSAWNLPTSWRQSLGLSPNHGLFLAPSSYSLSPWLLPDPRDIPDLSCCSLKSETVPLDILLVPLPCV